MATTSIGADRGQGDGAGAALERYPDAAIMRDDKKLYFGTDGDFSIEYDENGNNVALTAGADLRISDTQRIQFGDGGDVTLTFNGTSLLLGGSFTVALSDTLPATSGAVFLRSDTGNVSDYLLVVRK